METRSVATVVGGSGFIGRYVVQRLVMAGHVVRVAVRDPERASFLKVMGPMGKVVPLYANIGADGTMARAVEDADIVVNLVGILAERAAGDFSRVQAEGAGRVARLSAEAGVKHLVQMSAIGADPNSPAKYARSKAEGETLVRQHFPQATILRPSLVFGPEDKFFNRFAELGGPKIMTFREILGWILAQTGRHRLLVAMPDAVARLMASVPLSGLTGDQLLMLQRDNVVDPALPGLAELGIMPTPIDLVVPGYLARYRKGGLRAGTPD